MRNPAFNLFLLLAKTCFLVEGKVEINAPQINIDPQIAPQNQFEDQIIRAEPQAFSAIQPALPIPVQAIQIQKDQQMNDQIIHVEPQQDEQVKNKNIKEESVK